MRKILGKEEANDILAPYFESIVGCIDKGFYDFIKITEYKDNLDVFSSYKKRTMAGIIHEQISARVKDEFLKYDEVKCNEWNKIFGLKIKDSLFIRFKKLNENFSPSNIKTNQNELFRKQLSISGFPDTPTFLYAGYIPNKTWTNINGIYLACWVGDRIQWVIDVGKFSSEQLDLNFNIVEPEPVTIDKSKKRVIIKKKSS